MGSQRMAEFSKKMGDGQERDNGTWRTFDGSGYGKILSDREFADRRRNQNKKVSPNVSLANLRKMTYHLERQHNDNNDGYATRKSLNEWFNNDVDRTKLAEAPRKGYKVLVGKRGKRKRCKFIIRRKRKERS
eukprot:9359428-Ditylum_brightwellii.AAC.1